MSHFAAIMDPLHDEEKKDNNEIIIGLSDIHKGAALNNAYMSASSDEDSSSEEGSAYMKKSESMGDSDSETEDLTGRGDTKVAGRLRFLVGLLFLSMGVCFPIVIYITSRSSEVENFEETFESLAAKVTDTVELLLAQKLAAVHSLGVSITSFTETSDSAWPYVTIPDYDLHAESARDIGNVLSVNLHPLVTPDRLEEWGQYSTQNIAWLAESQARYSSEGVDRSLFSRDERQLQFSGPPIGISGKVFSIDEEKLFGVSEVDQNTTSYPTWQSMPAIASTVNLDAAGVLPSSIEAIQQLIRTERAVISRVEIFNSSTSDAGSFLSAYLNLLVQDYLGDDAVLEGAIAFLYYPVFDRFEPSSRQVVGFLSSVIYLEQFFADVLPSNAQTSGSATCVVENSCGDIFSYKVSGSQTEFLGEGDLHDTNFDSMGESYPFSSVGTSKPYVFSDQNVPLDTDYCAYTVHVYPHEDLYDSKVTNDPLIYAIAMGLVVLFISGISIVYDHYIQRRMKRAVKSAKENRAIVSSLFPANVRDRLIQEEEERMRKEEFYPRRRNSMGSKPSIGDQSRRNSNENGRRFSNDRDQKFPNERRRHSGDHGISDYFPFGSAVAGLTSIALAPAMALAPAKLRLKFFLNENNAPNQAPQQQYSTTLEGNSSLVAADKPIADLFLNCTVLFADIAGFTAWSSEREPEQVFTLLQAIFQKFDHLARKRNIFKVETIGDCYVAVTGLPDPQPDHAVRMTKFARACMHKVSVLTQKLEVSLGPGTGDLRMRFGLHSGPVTAGVLRGEKSRFQLFGDTVNTASRMESTGQKNRIQVSQSTAELLIESGKENWIQPREDLVHAKGKGKVQTYWVLTRRQPSSVDGQSLARPKFIQSTLQDSSDVESVESGGSIWHGADYEDEADESGAFDLPHMLVRGNQDRLIDWQVDLLLRILKQIMAGREVLETPGVDLEGVAPSSGAIFEEVSESIELPNFDPKAARARALPSSVEIPDIVVEELRDYVRMIADRYRNNPFHNFAHANHVSMSANKLLGRIVKPEVVDYHRKSVGAVTSDLHDVTYGITSDPISHFAIMISTLIHDVDHTGVSNMQREKEDPELATRFQHKSVAEQNSIDLAWKIMIDPRFSNLQKAMFASETEAKRFRQLVVNLVMATDIFDKDQKKTRDIRWDKVFHSNLSESVEEPEFRNLKAMIVIEHIMQAADVSHTMQHWQIYTKWNERLFNEMYRAFEDGRSEKDPSLGWYKGELWFFDNYVIPLAKKLDECGVFGVTSDECLNYALENRKEWEMKGEEIVKQMVERVTKRTKADYMSTGPMKFNTVAPKQDLALYARRSDTIVTGLYKSHKRPGKSRRQSTLEAATSDAQKNTPSNQESETLESPKAPPSPIVSSMSPSLKVSKMAASNGENNIPILPEGFFDDDEEIEDVIFEA